MTPALWSLILGPIMTLLTAFITKKAWPTAVKALVAIAVSIVLAVAQGIALGQFTLETIVQNLTVIFASGEALYGLYFKHLFDTLE